MYRHNNNTKTLSSLQHYFVRPLGSFNHFGVLRRFQDITYVEYFSLFRLAKYNHEKMFSTNYYLEQENEDGCPKMHVILRTATARHFARLHDISLSHGDAFYLRAILQLRPCSSFLHARTVDGVEYTSYQNAATALHLFSEETEAEYTLREAIEHLKTPAQLRYLFVDLLVDDCILTPLLFWDTFRHKLCKDFCLRHPAVPQIGIDHALEHLALLLEEHGKRPSDYHLPEPTTYGHEVEHKLQKWASISQELAAQADSAYQTLNEEQREIHDEIMFAIKHQQPLLLFVDGKAGVGKSYLINALYNRLRSRNLIAIPTVTSAFAAQLYPGGRTAHSTFKVRQTSNC
jgi:hypothetical protein